VWLLLAPRDYLSTFMKLGTIFALVLGVFLVLPALKMPALTKFVDGSGLVFAGKLFPFCFITIACGAISGFHTLISSGTTPKIITRESYARPIGYGAMLLESLVAIVALVAACSLDPGVYLSMNVKGAGATPEAVAADTVAKVQGAGFTVSTEEMARLANEVKEKTLFGRTGGAATLAVGMAGIFSASTGGRWVDLWYHFAIMFEALFILTTLDAGTRVGRYLLQDSLGNIWKPLGDTKNVSANLLSSAIIVGAWGYFLIQGVRDPLGGINSLWPLFGIANQLLAAIALCLAATVLLKMQLTEDAPGAAKPRHKHPAIALVAIVPLAWLLIVTIDAGCQKIWSADPKIGFLSQARNLEHQVRQLEQAGTDGNVLTPAAKKALHDKRILIFNQYLDATVAGTFLLLVISLTIISAWEWCRLLARKRAPDLREEEPVWLPGYAVAEAGRPANLLGVASIVVALAKEVSGQASVDRALSEQPTIACNEHLQTATDRYVTHLDERYKSIRRCC
jgi:carbon starvation protein